MEVLEANVGMLSNFEVMELLRKRGADKGPSGGSSITAGECKVYNYLAETPAATQTQERLDELFAGMKPFLLTDAEKLQAVNLRPSDAVAIHVIVEDCDERLCSSQVDRFVETVTEELPEPPSKQGADQKDDEEEEEREDANADKVEEEEPGGDHDEDVGQAAENTTGARPSDL